MSRILFASCVAALLYSTKIQAQRIPAGALPMNYNGGFAGEAGAPRVAAFSLFDYGPFPYYGSDPYVLNRGSFISVDNFVKKIRSGVGLTAGHQTNDHSYRSTSMSLAISPKFSHLGKYTFAPFADFSFGRTHYLMDPLYNPVHFVSDNFSFKSGFLLNSDKAYIGVSAEILRDGSRYAARFLENVEYYLQAGYTFQRTPGSDFSFTPQLVLSYQRIDYERIWTYEPITVNWLRLVDLSLGFRHKKFIWGINNTGLMAGYQSDRFKLQVTNFYTDRHRAGEFANLSNSEHFYLGAWPFPDSPKKYFGCISLRYLFKENSFPK